METQNDINRLPVEEHPTEVKELTTYKDGEMLVESKIESQQDYAWDASRTVKSENLGTVFGRSYEIGGFTWTSAQSRGTKLAQYNFPSVLFEQAQLNTKSVYFAYFRCKAIKVGIRLNSTEFHYGRINMSHVVGQTHTGKALHDEHYQTRRNNHPYLVSAMSGETHELEIPWTLPLSFIELTRSSPWVASDHRGAIARVTFDVLQALGMSAPSTIDVDVTVFASFVEPELFGATIPATLPPAFLSKALSLYKEEETSTEIVKTHGLRGKASAQGRVEKKRKKPQNNKESEDKIDSVVSTAHDFVGVIEEIVSIGESVSSAIGPIMALLDKPNSIAAAIPVQTSNGRDMMHGEGVDLSVPFSLSPTATLSGDTTVMPDGGVPMLYSIMSTPGWLGSFEWDTSTAVNTMLWSYLNQPWSAPNAAVGGYSLAFAPGYDAWYSAMFKYWRGSMKYLFVFTTSKFTTARVRLTFLPGATTAASSVNHTGDVYSRVVDIKGDTLVDFSVPWVYSQPYASMGNAFDAAASGSNSNGVVQIELINKTVSNDQTVAREVYCDIYRAVGPDFQVNFFSRDILPGESSAFEMDIPTFTPLVEDKMQEDIEVAKLLEKLRSGEIKAEAQCSVFSTFQNAFEPVITSTGYKEDGFVTNEVYGPVTDLMKVYVSDPSVSQTPSFALPLVGDQRDSITWCMAPFVYRRGSTRKKFYIGQTSAYPIEFYYEAAQDVNSTLSGVVVNSNSGNKVLEICYPWYARLPYGSPSADYSGFTSRIFTGKLSHPPLRAFVSAGDDYMLSSLYSPPIFGNPI